MMRRKRSWSDQHLNFPQVWIFPEFKKIRSERERSKAIKLATKKAWKNHRLLNVVLGILILSCLALYLFDLFSFKMFWQNVPIYILPALNLAVHTAVLYWMRRNIRLELRLMLKLDFWCRQCDYLLHQNTSGVCPECGAEIPAGQQALIANSVVVGREIERGFVSDPLA